MVVFDSVSRQHFYRNFPQTVRFLNETVATGKYSQDIIAYDFLMNNGLGLNSHPNVIPLIYGYDIEKHNDLAKGLVHTRATDEKSFMELQENALWKWYEQHGFVTMFGYETGFDFLTKQLGKFIEVDHTASTFWKAATNAFAYNEFKDNQQCFGLKDSHRYMLDYSIQFMKNYEGLNKFAYMHMNPGHENSGTVIRTADPNLKEYLEEMFDYLSERKDEDFVIMLLADHGKNFDTSLAGFKESILPFHIMFANKRLIKSLGAHEILKHNTYTLTSRFDWHLTLKHLAIVPYSSIDLDSKMYEKWKIKMEPKSAHSLLLEKNEEDRSCEMLGIPSHLCSCNAFDHVDLEEGLKLEVIPKIADQGIRHINHAAKNFEYVCENISLDSIQSISKQGMTKKYEPTDKIKIARSIHYKLKIFTNTKAVFEVFGLISNKKEFDKYKRDTKSGAFPIDTAKHTIDGQSEEVKIQLKQVTRVDAYRGICEELSKLTEVAAPLCICKQPFYFTHQDLQSNKNLTMLYENLLLNLDIIVGEETISCQDVCRRSNMHCKEWGLELINNIDVLKQSWLTESGFNVTVDGISKSFRDIKIERTDIGELIGIKNSTLYLALPENLDCDGVEEDIRPICTCGY